MKQGFHHTNKASPNLIGRFPVILVALLFLAAAILSALPSASKWSNWIHGQALAGFETPAETTRERPSVLGEYYDTPLLPQASAATSADSIPILPQPTDF